jgi:protein-disulfide isomerase
VPAVPSDPLPPGHDIAPERSRRLLFALGGLALVSAVIAAVVIVSSGGQPKLAEDPAAQVRTSPTSLIVGRTDAPTKVVVFEDFASTVSREFEIASRDFLEVEAAQGGVLVEYRPFPSTEGYSRQSVEAWAAVLQGGTAEEAMAFHELLFDRQPASGAPPPTAADLTAWAVDAGADEDVVATGLESADSSVVDAARDAARAADVGGLPWVIVDGEPLDPGTGIELADRLQRQILED